MKNIEKQIDELDKNAKDRAEATLKAITDNYRNRVSQRISDELAQAEACRRTGDDRGTKHHEMLVEIYKSLFNIENKPAASHDDKS